MVRKRSGKLQAFDPDKLLGKLLMACNKRPVSEKAIREFAYSFEDETSNPEITSDEIGARVLRFLQQTDAVAYIRFLSVYQEFDSVGRFIEEIKQLDGSDADGASGAEGTASADADGGEPTQAEAEPH